MTMPKEVAVVLANLAAVVVLFVVGFVAAEGHLPPWVGGAFTGGFLLAGAWLGVVSVYVWVRAGPY